MCPWLVGSHREMQLVEVIWHYTPITVLSVYSVNHFSSLSLLGLVANRESRTALPAFRGASGFHKKQFQNLCPKAAYLAALGWRNTKHSLAHKFELVQLAQISKPYNIAFRDLGCLRLPLRWLFRLAPSDGPYTIGCLLCFVIMDLRLHLWLPRAYASLSWLFCIPVKVGKILLHKKHEKHFIGTCESSMAYKLIKKCILLFLNSLRTTNICPKQRRFTCFIRIPLFPKTSSTTDKSIPFLCTKMCTSPS